MINRRSFHVAGTLLFLGIGVAGFALTEGAMTLKQGRQIQPYLVETWHYYYDHDSDAVGTIAAKDVRALDAGGTYLTMNSTAKAGLDKYSRRLDYPDGRYVKLADPLQMKASGRHPDKTGIHHQQMLLALSRGCLQLPEDKIAGHETIKGVETVVLRRTDSLRHLEIKTWRAPVMGCEAVQQEIWAAGPDGKRHGLDRAIPVQILLGKTDNDLFKAGDGYTEAPPSRIYERFFESIGLGADACDRCSASWAKQDRDYWKSRGEAAPPQN